MYLLGFLAGMLLGRVKARKPGSGWRVEEPMDLLFYIAVGIIAGGRLGYVVFYNPAYYLQNPFGIFALWDGGMAFHGGLIGVILAMLWYARKTRREFFAVADFVAPLVPPGILFGRLGNFINQELWGRATDLPWGVFFHTMPDSPRHPSQLYEAGLEGLLLFAVLWWYSARPRRPGQVSGLFLVIYGLARFAVEFVREPDAHIGPVAMNWLTMGQLLCVPMILGGLYLLARRGLNR